LDYKKNGVNYYPPKWEIHPSLTTSKDGLKRLKHIVGKQKGLNSRLGWSSNIIIAISSTK